MDLDLVITDTQPSQLVGVHEEFISSPRLDNLVSSYCALSALSNDAGKGSWISMACLFDHEEVGSSSAQGADSALMDKSMERIYMVLSGGKH